MFLSIIIIRNQGFLIKSSCHNCNHFNLDNGKNVIYKLDVLQKYIEKKYDLEDDYIWTRRRFSDIVYYRQMFFYMRMVLFPEMKYKDVVDYTVLKGSRYHHSTQMHSESIMSNNIDTNYLGSKDATEEIYNALRHIKTKKI